MSLYDDLYGVDLTRLDGTEDAVEQIEDDVDVGDTDDDIDNVSEETTIVTEDPVAQESEELQTELLDVQESIEEEEDVAAQVEDAQEAAIATEAFLANLLYTREKGGLTPAHAELSYEHVKYIAKHLKMNEVDVPAIDFGLESFSTASGIALSTETAIESVKNFFIKIIDGILKGIAWLMDKGSQMISTLFNNFEKMGSYASKLREKVSGLNEKHYPKENTYKSAGHAIALNVAGRVVSPVDAAIAVQEVATEIASKWNISVLGQKTQDISKSAETELSDFEKNIDFNSNTFDKKDADRSNTRKQLVDKASLAVSFDMKDIQNSLPFASGSGVSSQEAKRAGVTNADDKVVHVSQVLPRNKVIVTVYTDPGKQGRGDVKSAKVDYRVYSKLNNYSVSERSGDISLKVLEKKDMEQVLTAVENILSTMSRIKKLMAAVKPTVSRLRSVITSLRAKYLSVTKKAREGNSFRVAIRKTSNSITTVKDMIGLLTEPGTSFSKYALFEVKGLLDIVNYSANQHKAPAK